MTKRSTSMEFAIILKTINSSLKVFADKIKLTIGV